MATFKEMKARLEELENPRRKSVVSKVGRSKLDNSALRVLVRAISKEMK